MKVRIGFVTNSSSHAYLVRNITDEVRTLWDLVQEAAENDWLYIEKKYSGEYTGSNEEDPEIIQKLKEDISREVTFPPHTEQIVEFASGWGGWGIMISGGIRTGKTKSFQIQYWEYR